MKILHATTFLNGGAGRVLMDLAIQQKNKGHEVFVVANKSEYEGYFHYKEYSIFCSSNSNLLLSHYYWLGVLLSSVLCDVRIC